MSSESEIVSAVYEFPKPERNPYGPGRPDGLSIDAILQRTHPALRKANKLVDFVTPEAAAEQELREKENELVRQRAQLVERERVVGETELLLAARERLLDRRERELAGARPAAPSGSDTDRLEKSLQDTREALALANKALADKERALGELRGQLESLKSQMAALEDPDTGTKKINYDSVNDPSLTEQVAFLREREAFIEQSENTLFDKAQELQEWETRLQQQADDQKAVPRGA